MRFVSPLLEREDADVIDDSLLPVEECRTMRGQLRALKREHRAVQAVYRLRSVSFEHMLRMAARCKRAARSPFSAHSSIGPPV